MEPETDWGHKKAKHILQRDQHYLGMSRYRNVSEAGTIESSDQFLYLVNRARLGFTEHEYLFMHETQPRSRYRARGGRHRAPQPSSSTSKSWYLEENDYIELHNIPSRMTFELSSYKGMHACRGGKLTSIELENPRPLLLW